MASFSGRTGEGVPMAGEIDRADIPLFMKRCVDDGWKRVAVGEGYRILAVFTRDISDAVWIHRDIFGSN